MAVRPAQVADVVVETRIEAPPEKVWQALTSDIGRWWPNEFYTGGQSESRDYVLEARPGGRMFERWTDTDGLLWGVVNSVVHEKRLDVWGITYPAWGGPGLWTGTWELSEESGGTRLKFTEASVGVVSEESMADKRQGWSFLFEGCLKNFLEGKPEPTWGGSTGTLD